MYWILFLLFLSGWYFFPKQQLQIKQEIPYENKYMLGTTVDETEELKTIGVVEDETPEGLVRMKFENGIFLYWAIRAIQYKYLETVARKYCIVYDCKDNYINIFKELALAHMKPVQQQIHPEVFASFKQYNTKRKQLKNRMVVNERCNQYSWKGKISEYDKPEESKLIREISYADYKKM
jgi:hypothetical protein